MKVFRVFLKHAGGFTAIALLLSGLGGLLSGAGILALQEVLGAAHATYTAAGIVAALGLAQILASVGARLVFARGLYEHVLVHLRRTVVHAVSAASLRAQEKTGNPRLWASIDTNAILVALAGNSFVMAARSVTTAVACIVAIAWTAPSLLPSVGAAIAAGVVLYALVSRRAARAAEKTQTLSEEVDRQVEGLTRGNRELRLNAARRQAFMKDGLTRAIHDFHQKAASSSIWNSTAARLLGLPMMALIGGVLFLTSAGTGELGAARASVVILLFLQAELVATLAFVDSMRRGELALGRIEGVLDALRTTEARGAAALDNGATWSTLTLEGVTATYSGGAEGRTFTLGPVDLTLARGETVFVIGGNGSGKSTLAKVLTGLYAPDGGSVRLDDVVIRDDNREAYRQLFSAIFSNHHVYQRLFGIEGESVTERGKALLRDLALDAKVDIQGGAYTTVALSSGQRKRLSMVTARLEDRSILVLDEWASDQDPKFRDLFYRSILPDLKKEGRTVVVISHDDRYFDSADRIVRMEDGRVAYDGKPAAQASEPRAPGI